MGVFGRVLTHNVNVFPIVIKVNKARKPLIWSSSCGTDKWGVGKGVDREVQKEALVPEKVNDSLKTHCSEMAEPELEHLVVLTLIFSLSGICCDCHCSQLSHLN